MHFLHDLAVFTGSAVLFGVLLLAIFLGSSECDCLSGYKPLDDYGDEDADTTRAPAGHIYAVALSGDGGLFILHGVAFSPEIRDGWIIYRNEDYDEIARFPEYTVISSVRKTDLPEAA